MRPSSLQVVTATFVVVLLVVLVTFVVLALRSDRQGDRAQKVADTPPPARRFADLRKRQRPARRDRR